MDRVLHALGWTLLHSFWQLALVGLMAALAMRAFPSPRTQVRLGGLGLLACLGVPLATFLHLLGRAVPSAPLPGSPMTAVAVGTIQPAGGPGLPQPWQAGLGAFLEAHLAWLVGLWALGVLIQALRLGGGWWVLRRWRGESQAMPEAWQATCRALADRMAFHAEVALRTTTRLATPVALGLWRPLVLVPLALLTALPEAHIEALLAHELAHLKRRDPLMNLLQGLVEVLGCHHPTVGWLSRRVRAAREHLADELAARALGDPRRLALALDALDDLQRASSHPSPHPSLALAARGGSLLSRIQTLLDPGARPTWSLPSPGLLALMLLPCAALSLKAALADPIPAPAALVAQVDAAARKVGVDPHLLRAVAWAESDFQPRRFQATGALGLLQVRPEVARKAGATDLDNPEEVLEAGARHLKALLEAYPGDEAKALLAYHAGTDAAEGKLSQEAQAYASRVQTLAREQAIQPAQPLVEGEVRGVVERMPDGNLSVRATLRHRGNLRMDVRPATGEGQPGTVEYGCRTAEGLPDLTPWKEDTAKLMVLGKGYGDEALVRCEERGVGLAGEIRVRLTGPYQAFRMVMKPAPEVVRTPTPEEMKAFRANRAAASR